MYNPTANPYKFQYLITGISGPGIDQVYLPTPPPDKEVHFKKENRWVRPEPEKHIKKAIKVLYTKSNPYSKYYDKNYISPYIHDIKKWEDQQWSRFETGFWFWNRGVKTYITPFYYWYLTEWNPYFGTPEYRETDKEITYWLQFIEEDPNSYGGMLNTIRRYGKSALMGGWLMWRTTRNFSHYSGMQGESDDKIEAFWKTHVLKPFRKLNGYVTPTYDTTSKQTADILFERPVARGKEGRKDPDIEDDDFIENDSETEDLESYIDWRDSAEGAYDQAVLHTYLMEEPGKTKKANVNDRWTTVKPCLRRGKFIRGKALLATTVEHMNVMDRGGKAYQKIFFESDYNKRTALNQTTSGLYAAFLPGDCAYEGYYDDYGHPMRVEAKRSILIERESKKHNPKDHAAVIRQYPLGIDEIFWVSAEQCVFNATILQKRKLFLDSLTVPLFSKFVLKWKDNKRFTEVIFSHDENGWFKSTWMFPGTDWQKYANKVRKNSDGTYSPLNESVFTAGVDPVDHRVVIENTMGSGENEYTSTRRSKPVMSVKRRYDADVDGPLTQEILEERRDKEYPYKTGVKIGMMDVRPSDPNVYYERGLMVLWLFGMSAMIELQKPGFINYLILNNCRDFVKQKYIPEANAKGQEYQGEGTAASTVMINEYTDAISTDVEYFGHTEPFVEYVNDKLMFNPMKTKEHDYTVADGWMELGERVRPKTTPQKILNIEDIMPTFRDNKYVPR
jgi:hypothetical protein